jgi:hypothetical protein
MRAPIPLRVALAVRAVLATDPNERAVDILRRHYALTPAEIAFLAKGVRVPGGYVIGSEWAPSDAREEALCA